MRSITILSLLMVGCASRTAAVPPRDAAEVSPPSATPADTRERVVHVLHRFAFGPDADDVEMVTAEGVDEWFERQLGSPSVPVDDAYLDATRPLAQLVEAMTQDSMMSDGGGDEASIRTAKKRLKKINFKKLSGAYSMAQLTRFVKSDNQVAEVMTDFWMNHFNVFARKGQVKFYAGHYVEHAIRPNALGRFDDLLIATARHPAMLIYLDNTRSRAPLDERALARLKRRDKRRAARGKRPKKRRQRDLNENYARELLELHTLGVDGGYEQQDVVEAARVLTGWGARGVGAGGGFLFRPKVHDGGQKVVLGRTFDGGEAAGLEMLRFLARHPSTGRHLARKLCQRFVADQPPEDCQQNVRRAHKESHGDIPTMLRAVYTSPSFFEHRRSKLKTPVEYLVSALRAVGARPQSPKISRVLARLGQPILMQPVPTGYPEALGAWTGGSAMLQRMNVAAQFGRGKVGGASIDLDRVIPLEGDLVAAVDERLLHGQGSKATLEVIRSEVERIKNRKQARAVAVTLAIGSPDFSKQ